MRPRGHHADARAGPAPPVCESTPSAEADAVLEEVRRSLHESPGEARAAALRLVALLTSRLAGKADGRGRLAPWQERKVEQYLRVHLQQPLRINEVAAHIAVSSSHFCRAFKESFGTTPHMYIVRLRLELAQRLMLTTRDPLSQIAIACGLADQAHLAKLFRHHMGESPSCWRRRRLAQADELDAATIAPHRIECETGPLWYRRHRQTK